jgi:hypothetical protein
MKKQRAITNIPADEPVRRIVYRQAKPQCGPAFEALVRGMDEDMKKFPGFLGAEIIPPATPQEEYQFIFRWANQRTINAWDASTTHGQWLQRLNDVAEGDPEYRLLSGMEAWFAPTVMPGIKPPPRLKMALISWLGVFPTVIFLQFTIFPLIAQWPFLLQATAFTALMITLMTWVVMPVMTSLFRPWLIGRKKQ